MDTAILTQYFPHLREEQHQQFALLGPLYAEWNQKINVISRKDIDNLYLHHVLHSLAIARSIQFKPGTRILDFGTGGGFPGIPLAIMFPESQFTMIDGTGKKIRVAQEIATTIGLKNVEIVQRRGEEERGTYHFVVSRAVMPLPDLVRMCRKNIAKESVNALPNGIICLKGGDLQGELHPFRHQAEADEISQWFAEPWFRKKYVVYLPL